MSHKRAIDILDEDKEHFLLAVNLFMPSEFGHDRKVDTEEGVMGCTCA